MRSPYQQMLWEELDKEQPEPKEDWLIFDGYEDEIEAEYGTVELDEDTCWRLVKKLTGITPLTAHYDKVMNGIGYLYEEEEF